LVEDVGLRLAQGVRDLRLEENLGPTREAISRGLASGTESVWSFVSSVRNDLAKRQQEYKERKEREAKQAPAPGGSSGNSPRNSRVKPLQLVEQEAGAGAPPPHFGNQGERALRGSHNDMSRQANGPATAVFAGVGEAGARATSFATSVGSFFSTKRNQLFPSRSPPVPSSPSHSPLPSWPDSPTLDDVNAASRPSSWASFGGLSRNVQTIDEGENGTGAPNRTSLIVKEEKEDGRMP
jgi:hypothetical protein